VVVSEEVGLPSLDHVAHGDIEHNDAGMGGRELGRENFIDVVTVCTEFLCTVGEDE